MQKQQFWESSYGGDYDPAFVIPLVREWFTVSRPKKLFWVNSYHIVQSLRKSHALFYQWGTHLPGLDSCPVSSSGGQRQRSNSQVFPLTTLHIAKWIYLCYLSSFPSIFLIRLFFHPLLSPISRNTHLYHWWHRACENGWNYLIVGQFHLYV